MQRLIPLIYFYIVSLIGLIILIVGIFSDVHFLVNKLSYTDYPLSYDTTQRCIQPQPYPLMKGAAVPAAGGAIGGQTGGVRVEKGVTTKIVQPMPSGTPTPVEIMQPVPNYYYTDCLKQVADERKQAEVADLEKALSFTIVGLIVFSIHFYFARKKSE